MREGGLRAPLPRSARARVLGSPAPVRRRSHPSTTRAEPKAGVPSVLVLLIVKDGAPWLRECLQALAAQTYPRLGVLAVDNGSRDGSTELLEQALGPGRVLALGRNAGMAGSVRAALERVPAAHEADFLLLLHDDTVLSPDAVRRMVEAATLEGVERVGVVGPKVVEWDDPRVLLEVGRTADRFGHPASPLQDGEVDHGQYDRVREVLFVSSVAMLVSREAWRRIGPPDERLASHHEDLDFCWRARLAGFRVLFTPLATVRHRGAARRGERPVGRRRTERYYAERAALAAMLKNYAAPSLGWLLPLSAVLAALRVSALALSRRFEEAVDIVAAWLWNARHLPGTIRRRARAQAVRRVRDRDVRRFMEPALVRMPRWIEAAGRIIAEQQELDAEEAASVRVHAASLARAHPVLVASVLATFVGALAIRSFVGREVLEGGVLPAFPASAGAFFRELVSAHRTVGLGGSQAASPALAALGALSWLLGGSPALAQKVVLGAGVPVAGAMCYRATLRRTGHRVASVAAGSAYAMSAVVLWAFSEGRIGLLVVAAVLPPFAERLEAAFRGGRGEPGWRLAAGAGVPLAIGAAFEPGVVLAAAALVGIHLLASRSPVRGLLVAAGAAAAGGALVFPIVPGLARGIGLGSLVGRADVADAAHLVLGRGPGSSPAAWFLPVAAALSLAIAGREERGQAWRMFLAAAAGTGLAWASAARWLPGPAANAPAYAALAATAEATLVGLGVRATLGAVVREAFGSRQVLAALLAASMAVGIGAQAVAAAVGGWAVRPGALPPAWTVIASDGSSAFRVLWLGRAVGEPFPPPGGDPQGLVEAGSSSVRYAVRDRGGVRALDLGRGEDPRALGALEAVLGEILSGTTRHGGSLLAPFGVRYVVAAEGDLPSGARAALDAQLDLDLVPAGGLVIYRNARALPPAALVPTPGWAEAARGDDLSALPPLPAARAVPLDGTPGAIVGTGTGEGLVYLSERFQPGWRMRFGDRTVGPWEAFGWATAFEAPSGPFRVIPPERGARSVGLAGLGVLWAVALWLTRKPAGR